MEITTIQTFKDFPNICCICLNNRNLEPFIQYDLLTLFENITNIKLGMEDSIPKNVCKSCLEQLENILSFITISKSNHVKLKQFIQENKLELFHNDISFDTNDTDIESHQCLDEFPDATIVKSEDEFPEETVKSEENAENIKFEAILGSKQIEDKKLRTLKCTMCGISFTTRIKLLQHQRKDCTYTKKFKCMQCEKTFVTKFKLRLHMRSHTKELLFECHICFKKFRHSSNLKRHDNTVHKGLKPYKCDVCGKEFATFQRKTEHQRIHTGERPYICAYCGTSFTKYSTRYAHEMRHKIKNGEIPKSDKMPKKYSRKKPDDPSELECTICNKMFSSKQTLGVHTQIHTGIKAFLCTICGKGFLRKNNLEVHVRIHTGERPYKCNSCGKNFRQSACYRSHLLSHKGERSYKCEICGRTFIQLGHLQTHIKTHTGEKPYKCSFCEKSFAQNGNLKAHTRIHTGERPYQCSVCFMGFYDSTSMKKHRKSHGNIEETDNHFMSA